MMRTFNDYASYSAWRKTSGGASTESVRLVGGGCDVWPTLFAAQAEIARLTRERDEALAKVAAAFEAAAKNFERWNYRYGEEAAKETRALTPATATAALNRMLRQATSERVNAIMVIVAEECLAVREGKLYNAILARADAVERGEA